MIETASQLGIWAWGLGFVTGAFSMILWEHTDDDDRDL